MDGQGTSDDCHPQQQPDDVTECNEQTCPFWRSGDWSKVSWARGRTEGAGWARGRSLGTGALAGHGCARWARERWLGTGALAGHGGARWARGRWLRMGALAATLRTINATLYDISVWGKRF